MEIRKFQQGGEVQDPAMQQTQQAGPTMDQIIPAMQQAVQNGDCNSLMQVCFMSVPVYPVRIIQKLLKMTKVRYLNRGGSPKDANNDIELDGMKIDRNLFTEKFRDSNDMSSWMDGYKHMDGPKLRRSVFKRVSEMANAVLSGNMTLEDLNKFKSSNKNFASDGDTKRRFLGGYDSRDENTVNAISAAYLMDVMKRSKSAEKKDKPSDLPKYESSFGDFMASIGINPEAASSVLSKYNPGVIELVKIPCIGKYEA